MTKTHISRSARQWPGSSGESAAAAISHSGAVIHSSPASSTTTGAITTRRTTRIMSVLAPGSRTLAS